MKKIFLALIILLSISDKTSAQIQNPNEPVCRIWYDYDANGQRVKRYYECKDPMGEVALHPIRLELFPNPTGGTIIVVGSETADVFVARIFKIDGIEIAAETCYDCNEIRFDVSDQPTGTYVVNVLLQKQGYDDLQKGVTVIKYDE